MNALTPEQHRMFKVVVAPMLRQPGDPKLPTFEEWRAAVDALMPSQQRT